MDELKADHELVITLEDGVLDGGFSVLRIAGNARESPFVDNPTSISVSYLSGVKFLHHRAAALFGALAGQENREKRIP